MPTRVRAHVDGIKQTNAYFDSIVRRSRNFRPVLRFAQRELEKANIENFRSRGATSGEPWMPLSNKYARWKLEHYGPMPIMIRRGALIRDLSFLSGPPNHIGFTEATFGTEIGYAKFHQTGTSIMPRRKIVFIPRLFAMKLGRITLNYLVSGSVTGLSANDVTGLFKS